MPNDSQPTNNQPKPNQIPSAVGSTGGERVIQPLSADLKRPQATVPPKPTTPVLSQVPAQVASSATTNPSFAFAPDNHFLTGSQLAEQKVKLPIGIYIIAAFNFIGFVISFFDTSQNSLIYTIAMLADLILAIGLLFRLEVARKFIVWLMGITLLLTVISLFLLVALQQRIKTVETNYNTFVSHLDQNSLTLAQKQELNTLQSEITVKEKQAGKAIAFTYIKLGVTAVESVVVMAYLTRPKVKEVFRKL